MSSKRSTFSKGYWAITLALLAVLVLSTVSPAFAAAKLRVGKVTIGTQTGTLTYGSTGSATYSVVVTAATGQGSGIINLGITGLPAGMASGFVPSTLTLTGGQSKASVLTLTSNGSQAAGTTSFTVTATGSNSKPVLGSLTIGKKTATVTANNLSKEYGTVLVPVGTEFTPSGFVNGDLVTSVTLSSAGFAAGATMGSSPYPIVPSAAIGSSGLVNYNIQYAAGSLALSPASLNVSGVVGIDKTYDGGKAATVDASGASLSGVIGADVVILNKSGASGAFLNANVGLQTIQVSGLTISGPAAANYTLIQPTTSANITPATLTVQAPFKAIATSFVGEPEYTPFISGFLGGDTEAVVSGVSCNDFTDAAGLNPVPDPVNPTDVYPGGAGDFYIICGGGSAANYTFSYLSGMLHVDTLAPQLVLPAQVNFGPQLVGTGSLVRSILVSNTGGMDLHLYGISMSNSQYQLVTLGSSCYSGGWPSFASPFTVAAGGSCTINTQFVPTVTGTGNNALVTIISDNGTSPNSVPLAGSSSGGQQVIVNRSFEIDANKDKVPDGWVKGGVWSAADGQDCAFHFGPTGRCSLKFVGNGLQNTAQQAFVVNGIAGNGIKFSLYSKASNVPTNAVYYVRVLLFKGTTQVAVKPVNFSKGSHTWQLMTGTFSAPAAFDKIVFQILYKGTTGTVWFDMASLIK